MRLIGTFEEEKEAYAFYSFLLKQGIQNVYEPFLDAETKKKKYRIWVEEEDDLPAALEWLQELRANPSDPKFHKVGEELIPKIPLSKEEDVSKTNKLNIRVSSKTKKKTLSTPLTGIVLVLCVFLFLWDETQSFNILSTKGKLASDLSLTPLEKVLLFDYPASFQMIDQFVNACPIESAKEIKDLTESQREYLQKAQDAPAWKGFYGLLLASSKKTEKVPLFEKIRQGQVWRLFTPCMLHRDFLHILFNMVWLWVLGKQIEERLSKPKMLFLLLIIGVISNVAQYLMSGPYFLGFSGIAVGMVGFIWARQKKAPWEGYPLQWGTTLFILLFVLAMFALEIFAMALQLFSSITFPIMIANTAHIAGGLIGILLGRISLFSRRIS